MSGTTQKGYAVIMKFRMKGFFEKCGCCKNEGKNK